MGMDRIQQMHVFIQVVDSGNFTRAAEALGLPRSTVSSTVQALEVRLGVQLLQRTTRVVRPTQEGLQFVDTARDLVNSLEQAEGMFRHRPENISGRLRIDVPSRIARRLIIPHLHDFRQQFPAVTLEISATDRMIDLVSEGLDAVVRMADPQDSELICRKIGDVQVASFASPGYLAEHGVPKAPADLAEHMLVNYALRLPATSSEWDGTEDGREISVVMQSHLCVDNAESYIAGGLHGHGLIQVPAYDVADDIAAGRLVEVLPEYRPTPIPISILYSRKRHVAPRLKVFMEWLEELLQKEGVVTSKA